MADPWRDELGEVRVLRDGETPPTSSLVDAFKDAREGPADAIVLRGYLGRSDFFKRTRDYLERASKIEVEKRGVGFLDSRVGVTLPVARVAPSPTEPIDNLIDDLGQIKNAADATAGERIDSLIGAVNGLVAAGSPIEQIDSLLGGLEAIKGAARAQASPIEPIDRAIDALKETKEAEGAKAASSIDAIKRLIDALEGVTKDAWPHVPLRLYLTPNLDSYVDFHRSSLLAYRREPRPERRDTFTVWLRLFEVGSTVPVPYRVVQETTLGPSFAAYLGGDLIDDYLVQSGSASSAWGDQSAVFGGGKGTGTRCGAFFGGRPKTGTACGE